jgi:hypothetical protein
MTASIFALSFSIILFFSIRSLNSCSALCVLTVVRKKLIALCAGREGCFETSLTFHTCSSLSC